MTRREQAEAARSAYFKALGIALTDTGEANLKAWEAVVEAIV